jgi:hypothetical protein
MTRRLFTLVSFVSLLLFFAAVTLSVVGPRVLAFPASGRPNAWRPLLSADDFRGAADGRVTRYDNDGAVWLRVRSGVPSPGVTYQVIDGTDGRPKGEVEVLVAGANSVSQSRVASAFAGGPPRKGDLVASLVWVPVPYQRAAALLALLPLAWLLRRVLGRILAHRGVARIGLCPACGYDLRATRDRCPECGAMPVAKGVT